MSELLSSHFVFLLDGSDLEDTFVTRFCRVPQRDDFQSILPWTRVGKECGLQVRHPQDTPCGKRRQRTLNALVLSHCKDKTAKLWVFDVHQCSGPS